jgi:hypothetical protein
MPSRSTITFDNPEGFFAKSVLPPAFRKRQRETRFRQEWNLSHFLYRCLMLGWNGEGDARQFMREFKGPKYQRGQLSGGSCNRWNRQPQGQVVITTHSLIDESTSFAGTTFTFRTMGTLRGTVLNGDPQFPVWAGEWWSEEPVTSIGDDYAVRYLSSGQIGTLTGSASAADAWVTISVDRGYSLSRQLAVEGIGVSIFQATFEIGPQPSGPADDSALLGLRADII